MDDKLWKALCGLIHDLNDPQCQLDNGRKLVARWYTADNDYNDLDLLYRAAHNREYSWNIGDPTYRIPHHIIQDHERARTRRNSAYKDVKPLFED